MHSTLSIIVCGRGYWMLSTGKQLYNKTCDFFNTFMKLNEHGRA